LKLIGIDSKIESNTIKYNTRTIEIYSMDSVHNIQNNDMMKY